MAPVGWMTPAPAVAAGGLYAAGGRVGQVVVDGSFFLELLEDRGDVFLRLFFLQLGDDLVADEADLSVATTGSVCPSQNSTTYRGAPGVGSWTMPEISPGRRLNAAFSTLTFSGPVWRRIGGITPSRALLVGSIECSRARRPNSPAILTMASSGVAVCLAAGACVVDLPPDFLKPAGVIHHDHAGFDLRAVVALEGLADVGVGDLHIAAGELLQSHHRPDDVALVLQRRDVSLGLQHLHPGGPVEAELLGDGRDLLLDFGLGDR